MKTINDVATDEQRWQAVEARDSRANGKFVFAVKTTGIFCRPSCTARHPLRKNVLFFLDTRSAQQAGFRPCKRCQPDKVSPELQRAERIMEACRIIESSPEPLTLEKLAARVAMSPYHFHRLFKSLIGLTPNAWQKAQRSQRLRDELSHNTTVTQAAYNAGFQSSSNFYQHADAALGMTARQYQHGGERATIRFVVGTSLLGEYLVAESERGVCAILLGNAAETLIAELETLFPQARLEANDADFANRVACVVSYLEHPGGEFPLPLDIQGTAFQQQVWQALRAIPVGDTLSYQAVAERIGNPKAVRAVAGACAANRLAVVVPCHRVVRNDGALSGYRWGVERKQQLLDLEAGQRKA